MQINQYFISNQEFKPPERGSLLELKEYKIWIDENLNFSFIEKENNYILLLGFVFDTNFHEKSFDEILRELANKPIESGEFFDYLNGLVGRFVMIVFNENPIIIHDSAGQRQVFYYFENEKFFATSSPKLFYELTEYEFVIPKDKKKIIESNRFRILEKWFPGDEFLDEKLKRLLPNYYIKINAKKIDRIPFSVFELEENELKKIIKTQIYGAIKACNLYFEKSLISVTAGSDSRLIFSCLGNESGAELFIFKRESENNSDLKMAEILSQKIKSNLQIIEPKEVSSEFLNFYKNQVLNVRISSKLRNIEWLKWNNEKKNSVVIVGYAGELLRDATSSLNFFQKKFNNHQDFMEYLNYPKNEYLENSISNWLDSADNYIKKCKNLSLLDLFHWEHHMASYCSKYAYEQDLSGVEIFCPLANRQLILNLIHNTTPEQRKLPNGIIYQIINENRPEWKGIPYNPKTFRQKVTHQILSILPLKLTNFLLNQR